MYLMEYNHIHTISCHLSIFLISWHVAACDIGGIGSFIADEPPIGDHHVVLPDAAITPDWKYPLPDLQKRQPWNGYNYRQTRHLPKAVCLFRLCSGSWE